MNKLRSFLLQLRDPSTRSGTAFWATLVATLFDACTRGLSWPHGAVLLTLAGLDQAARYLAERGGGPGDPTAAAPLAFAVPA